MKLERPDHARCLYDEGSHSAAAHRVRTWHKPLLVLQVRLALMHLQVWPAPARQSPWLAAHIGSCMA